MLASNRKWVAAVAVLAVVFVAAYFGPDLLAWQNERSLKTQPINKVVERVRSHPDDVAAHYRLGQLYAQSDRQLEATREFLAVIQKDPSRADVLNDLGVSYMLQERYHEALLALQSALEAKPGYAPAQANLGRLRMATKMPYSAVDALELAARWAPNDVATWSDLGLAYHEVARYGDAESAFRKALKINPGFTPALVGLGLALADLGRNEEALAQYREAVRRDGNNPSALGALGHQLVESGNREAAEEARGALMKVLETSPNDPEAYYDLGRLSLMANDPVAAEGSLRKALSLSVDHTGAMTQIQRALRLQDKNAEADRWAEALRKASFRTREVNRLEERVSRKNATGSDRAKLAELYIEQGRLSLAGLIMREMQMADPKNPLLPKLSRMLMQKTQAQAGHTEHGAGPGPSHGAPP